MPAQKQITLQHEKSNAQSHIILSTVDGRTLKQIIPTSGSYQTDIELSGIAPGIYLIKWSDGNGQTETLKLIKQ